MELIGESCGIDNNQSQQRFGLSLGTFKSQS